MIKFGGLSNEDGLDFADKIAAGMKERATWAAQESHPGVMLNIGEVLMLVEAYEDLRSKYEEHEPDNPRGIWCCTFHETEYRERIWPSKEL